VQQNLDARFGRKIEALPAGSATREQRISGITN